MKPVTAETVQAEIRRLEAFTACTTRPLSITEEFHLSCLRQLLGALEPVQLPQRYVCEGYHIGEAYLEPDAEGDCFDRDEVIEALQAHGLRVKP